MAATIEIACPDCGNASAAPADLAGKKIRCKQCKSVFVVEAKAVPEKVTAKAPAGKPGTKPAPAAKAPAKPVKHADDEADKNPYGVVTENLAARCPFCALPMDPPDARICIHCGYDMQKRKREESRHVYELGAADYFMYHLPTIGCLIGIVICLAIDFASYWYAEDLLKDSWMDNGDGTFMIKQGIVPVYVTLATGILGIVPMARIVIKRLIKFIPPEVKVRTDEE